MGLSRAVERFGVDRYKKNAKKVSSFGFSCLFSRGLTAMGKIGRNWVRDLVRDCQNVV